DVGRWIDSAEPPKVIRHTHPQPQSTKQQADNPTGETSAEPSKANSNPADEVEDNLHRPDGFVVLLKDAQKVLCREREHGSTLTLPLTGSSPQQCINRGRSTQRGQQDQHPQATSEQVVVGEQLLPWNSCHEVEESELKSDRH